MILSSAILGGVYPANGVVFDGTNDYISRTSALTGIADGAVGLVSFWVKGAAPGSSSDLLSAGTGAGEFIGFFFSATTGVANFVLRRSTGAICLSMESSSAALDGSWHHVLAAWDTAADASCKVYVDGSDVTTLSTRTANNIDYTVASWRIGAQINTANFKMAADVAELYFTTEWIDITSSANREKFAKNGRPVSLGADGSKPTGTAPLLYLKGPASSFNTNRGSGGDFTVTGALTDSATRPSY